MKSSLLKQSRLKSGEGGGRHKRRGAGIDCCVLWRGDEEVVLLTSFYQTVKRAFGL